LRQKVADGERALDLLVTATAVEVSGRRFTVAMLQDIGDRKRLDVFTRAFFHDLLNTAGAIAGYAQFLAEMERGAPFESECYRRIGNLSTQLIDEIQAHRDLVEAEAGALAIQVQAIDGRDVLERLAADYAGLPCAAEKKIVIGRVWDGDVHTDLRLLRRILGNMLKNALEASASGETVTIELIGCGATLEFHVHNEAVMPPEVQMQVFHRSFSTKGEKGRGIGTHSMKLLAERYLGGQVNFVSRAGEGTTFCLRLPKAGDSPEAPRAPT
jgi:signal transduction histidine kinase